MGPKDLEFGLLGERLGHSFSPAIHRQLAGYDYRLVELPPEEVEPFLRAWRFRGLNVTIPYKKTVMACCDALSPAARRIGSVNTLLRRPDGTLYGDNTDYDGFRYLLQAAGAQVQGKKALVLGSGGASLTVHAVLADLGARETIGIPQWPKQLRKSGPPCRRTAHRQRHPRGDVPQHWGIPGGSGSVSRLRRRIRSDL